MSPGAWWARPAWWCRSPPSNQSDAGSNLNPAQIALPLSGTYRLEVTNGGYTGAYSFNLLDLGQPDVTLPTDGSTQQITLNPSNSTEIVQFAGTAGTDVFAERAQGVYNVVLLNNIDIRA